MTERSQRLRGIVVVLLALLSSLALHLALLRHSVQATSLWLSYLLRSLSAVLPFLLCLAARRMAQIKRAELPQGRPLAAVVSEFCFLSAVLQLLPLLLDFPFDPPRMGGWVSLFVTTVLLAPILEELFFRTGWLMLCYDGTHSAPLALIAGAAAFALMHGIGLAALIAFLCGIWLGRIRMAGGRLWICILCHAGHNLLALALLLIGERWVQLLLCGVGMVLAAGVRLLLAWSTKGREEND